MNPDPPDCHCCCLCWDPHPPLEKTYTDGVPCNAENSPNIDQLPTALYLGVAVVEVTPVA